jgi:hypothetical protein
VGEEDAFIVVLAVQFAIACAVSLFGRRLAQSGR